MEFLKLGRGTIDDGLPSLPKLRSMCLRAGSRAGLLGGELPKISARNQFRRHRLRRDELSFIGGCYNGLRGV